MPIRSASLHAPSLITIVALAVLIPASVTTAPAGAQTGLSNQSIQATWDPSQAPPVTVHFEWLGASGGSVSWDFGDGVQVVDDDQISHTYAAGGLFEVEAIENGVALERSVEIYNEVLIDDFEDVAATMALWAPIDGLPEQYASMYPLHNGDREAWFVLTAPVEHTGASSGKPNIIYTGGDDEEGGGGFTTLPSDKAFFFETDIRLDAQVCCTFGSVRRLVAFEGGTSPLSVQTRYQGGVLKLRLKHGSTASSWLSLPDEATYRLAVEYEPGKGGMMVVHSASGSSGSLDYRTLEVAGETAAARGLRLGTTAEFGEFLPRTHVYLDDLALYRYGYPSN